MDNMWKAIHESPAAIYGILTTWLAYLHLSRPSNATCAAKHTGITNHDHLLCKKMDDLKDSQDKLLELFIEHLENRK